MPCPRAGTLSVSSPRTQGGSIAGAASSAAACRGDRIRGHSRSRSASLAMSGKPLSSGRFFSLAPGTVHAYAIYRARRARRNAIKSCAQTVWVLRRPAAPYSWLPAARRWLKASLAMDGLDGVGRAWRLDGSGIQIDQAFNLSVYAYKAVRYGVRHRREVAYGVGRHPIGIASGVLIKLRKVAGQG